MATADVRLVAHPFRLEGPMGRAPVRIVAFDWHADEGYADADARGIVEVYQVTWYESDNLLDGWLGDICQLRDGSWIAGVSKREEQESRLAAMCEDFQEEEGATLAYATMEDVALQVVLDWQDFLNKMPRLTPRECLHILLAGAFPDVEPPPIDPLRRGRGR